MFGEDEVIHNIAGGAVHAHRLRASTAGFFHAPVAGGEEDFAPGCFQRHRHGEVARLLQLPDCGKLQKSYLSEIHAPVRKRLRIDNHTIAAG